MPVALLAASALRFYRSTQRRAKSPELGWWWSAAQTRLARRHPALDRLLGSTNLQRVAFGAPHLSSSLSSHGLAFLVGSGEY